MADIHKAETRGRYNDFGPNLSAPGGPDVDIKTYECKKVFCKKRWVQLHLRKRYTVIQKNGKSLCDFIK